jgi:hypothetical protein
LRFCLLNFTLLVVLHVQQNVRKLFCIFLIERVVSGVKVIVVVPVVTVPTFPKYFLVCLNKNEADWICVHART